MFELKNNSILINILLHCTVFRNKLYVLLKNVFTYIQFLFAQYSVKAQPGGTDRMTENFVTFFCGLFMTDLSHQTA
jgi:hypothetical protein